MSLVSLAQDRDLDQIITWLKEEFDKEGTERGFYCNRDVIRSYHQKSSLYVYRKNNFPLGFITGPLYGPDILSVHPSHRKRGIGKILFEHVYALAQKEKVSALDILCCPQSSIPFWRKMGFSFRQENGQTHGIKIVEIEHELPQGRAVDVVIRTYPESRKYDKTIEPLKVYQPVAIMDNYGLIHLKQRLVFVHEPLDKMERDLVLSMSVNGTLFYENKENMMKHMNLELSEISMHFT